MQDSDFNADGTVDGHDFLAWQRGVGMAGAALGNGDADGNGLVNGVDLNMWRPEFGLASGMADSVCFKLYFDPAGITAGRLTAVLDVPDVPGALRLDVGPGSGIFARHPLYDVRVTETSRVPVQGRQRIETKIEFNAVNPLNPPVGPLTIFGYQVHDQFPQLGPGGVDLRFKFNPGDFITIFDSDVGQSTTFTQLPDVPLVIKPPTAPLLQPSNAVLAIDVDPATSASSYPAVGAPSNAVDLNPASRYINFGKRNTGLIVDVQQGTSPNLLANPGFEAPIISGVPPNVGNWAGASGGPGNPSANNSTAMPRNGAQHLALSVGHPLDTAQVQQVVPGIFPGSMMSLTGFVKTPPFPFQANAFASIAWRDAMGGILATNGAPLIPTGDYTQFVVNGTAPAGTTNALISCVLLNATTNSALFVDDMSFSSGAAAPRIAHSVRFVSGDAAPANDPITWELYGTNDTVLSADNSDSMGGENWTFISGGVTGLPPERLTVGQALSFANSTPYASYRFVFPDLKDLGGATAMQIGDIGLFESNDGSGPNLLAFASPVRAIQLPSPQADSPPGNGPEMAIDGKVTTKYVNFGKANSGIIVTPNQAGSIVTSFVVTTGDAELANDPDSWSLFGTNDAISSPNFSQGNQENWTLIGSGPLGLPDARLTQGPTIAVNNTTPYKSYRLIFPTLKDANQAAGLQIAEVQFFGAAGQGHHGVPEPGAMTLAACGLAALSLCRSRRGRRRA